MAGPSHRLAAPQRRTRSGLIGVFAPLMLLAACQSAEEKAARSAAEYDVAVARGDLAGAKRAIAAALAAQPDNPAYLSKLGELEAARGALPQAYLAFRRLLDVDPNNVQALEIAAQFAATAGDRAQALRYLDTLTLLRPDSPRGRIARATIAVSDGKLPQALAQVNQLLVDAPTIEEAIALKARILSQMGEPLAGAAFLESKLPVMRSQFAMLRQLLTLYQMAGDQRGIAETYLRLYQLQPKNPDYQFQYARIMLARGSDSEAMTALDTLRRRHARSPAVRGAIARLLGSQRGPEAALAEIHRPKPPASPAIRAEFAHYLLSIGRAADAKALLAPIADDAPDVRTVTAHVALAEADFALGSRQAARTRVDRALQFDPTDARGLRLRVKIALADKRLEEALGNARLLVSSYPGDERARLLLVRVHEARKEPLLVGATYRKAANDFVHSPTMLAAFTDYLVSQGDLQEAIDAAREFTKANPRSRLGWQRQASLCERGGDPSCEAVARAKLADEGRNRERMASDRVFAEVSA